MNDQEPANDEHRSTAGVSTMAASATLHCLTGCSIGEIAGLVIGSAASLSNWPTVALSFGLSFVFGYALSSLPLLRAGLDPGAAARVVLASDTVSILTMELVDNATELAIPGAMTAGLRDSIFWWSTLISLGVAYCAAFPVNRALLVRGKGHALTHEAHARARGGGGWRTRIPAPPPATLAAVILAFVLGGWLVAAAPSFT